MPEYRLSRLAKLDLIEIADYTVDTWGPEQANRYIDGLVNCFAQIAQSPALGRPCDQVHPGYRRAEQAKHVVFYRTDEEGIYISRILHYRMLPNRHPLKDF